MELVGRDMLTKASRRYVDTRRWLETWMATVDDATWQSLADVRKVYSSADGVPLRSGIVVIVFNVKGNAYRLLTTIDYQSQSVTVLELLTHADYSRDRWKERY
jgi:mRNA interferase HigB